jgi:hypothetical protein
MLDQAKDQDGYVETLGMAQSSISPSKEPSVETRAKDTFDYDAHKFMTPRKSIETPMHVTMFREATGCSELMSFITALQDSVKTSRMTKTEITPVSQKSAKDSSH